MGFINNTAGLFSGWLDTVKAAFAVSKKIEGVDNSYWLERELVTKGILVNREGSK